MGRIIAVANQKGGVGKTTTATNLSACLAEKGKKVLAIDIDPQGNMSSGLGIDKNEVENTVYELILEESSLEDCIIENVLENVSLLSSNVNLAGAEIELIGIEDKEFILKKQIEKVRDNYDYIFIDCPPSLGMLTINSLTAVDSVLIPIQCEYYALEGVSQLMGTIKLVKSRLNPDLDIQGVVLSMFDGRANLSIQVVDEVKRYFKGSVYTTLIPRNVRLAEAPSHGKPVIYYDSKCKGAVAYMELAEEFIDLEEDII